MLLTSVLGDKSKNLPQTKEVPRNTDDVIMSYINSTQSLLCRLHCMYTKVESLTPSTIIIIMTILAVKLNLCLKISINHEGSGSLSRQPKGMSVALSSVGQMTVCAKRSCRPNKQYLVSDFERSWAPVSQGVICWAPVSLGVLFWAPKNSFELLGLNFVDQFLELHSPRIYGSWSVVQWLGCDRCCDEPIFNYLFY